MSLSCMNSFIYTEALKSGKRYTIFTINIYIKLLFISLYVLFKQKIIIVFLVKL